MIRVPSLWQANINAMCPIGQVDELLNFAGEQARQSRRFSYQSPAQSMFSQSVLRSLDLLLDPDVQRIYL